MNTLVVGLMVKNESKIIERCLTSILGIADIVVIVDTGSTDDTIIRAGLFLQKHNVNFKIYQEKFENFAYNRTDVLNKCRPEGDYTLLIDADEVFIAENILLKQDFNRLTKDFYEITIGYDSVRYNLPRLTSNKYEWHYDGVTHEYLKIDNKSSGHLDNYLIFQVNDSYRRTNNLKFQDDIELLKRACSENIDDNLKRRYIFYLAQTYCAMKDYQNALYYYELRTKIKGWSEEIFYSYYMMASIKSIIEPHNVDEITRYCLAAYEAAPYRIESLYILDKLLRHEGLINVCDSLLLPKIKSTPCPETGLFIEKNYYECT